MESNVLLKIEGERSSELELCKDGLKDLSLCLSDDIDGCVVFFLSNENAVNLAERILIFLGYQKITGAYLEDWDEGQIVKLESGDEDSCSARTEIAFIKV